MAGAGYKLFSTGDVLTASDVNTYLQQQTVMVFADASARTTALSGVLAEGMMSYLQDTDTVYVYNGAAWVGVSQDQTPLTTKGDLFTYSTADARLPVGNNGETLVADSSASTGLRWQADFSVGRNKLINADFRINQRNFSSVTAAGSFGFDRWKIDHNSTLTYTPQTFTPGAAPVAGYEGTTFTQLAVTTSSSSGEYVLFNQPIEDVRTFAGQTVTLSFWAKATSGTPSLGASLDQNFGSGGSAQVEGIGQKVTLSTSWTRYSLTYSLASLSGKTIGTSSFLNVLFWLSAGSSLNTRSGSVGNQSATFQIWGVQLEAGSVATPFTTATGTLAGEFAAACRYYYVHAEGSNVNIGAGAYFNANLFAASVSFPTQMRIAPSLVYTTGSGYYQIYANNGTDALDVLSIVRATKNSAGLDTGTGTAGTTGHGGLLATANAASSVAFNAEL